MLNGLHLGF